MMSMMTMLLLIGDVVTCSDISLLIEKYDVKVVNVIVVDEVRRLLKKSVSIAHYLLLVVLVQLDTCTFIRCCMLSEDEVYRCCRYSPMIRKAFGCDEVAEDDGCIFEIDIRFPSCIVKRISFPFHEKFIIVGIR